MFYVGTVKYTYRHVCSNIGRRIWAGGTNLPTDGGKEGGATKHLTSESRCADRVRLQHLSSGRMVWTYSLGEKIVAVKANEAVTAREMTSRAFEGNMKVLGLLMSM